MILDLWVCLAGGFGLPVEEELLSVGKDGYLGAFMAHANLCIFDVA